MRAAGQRVARGGVWCLVVLAGLAPGRVGAAADDSEGWVDSAFTAAVDTWDAIFDPNDELECALPTREDWDQFWTATQLALVSSDDTLLTSMDGDVQASLAWLDQTAGMEPLADWLRQRVDYFEAALDTAVPAVGAPPTTTRPPAPRVPPPPRPTVAASRPATAARTNAGRPAAPRTWPRTVKPREKPVAPAATHTLAAKARQVDYWRERLADRTVPAERMGVVPALKRIFREEGVPADLVWMAEAESTLNPKARSPAGATGLFQFMPATAQRFGLKLKPRDERLEPDKSARAAARYLKELNGRYGDWSLALAAYNAGEGTVGKALKRAGGGGFEEAAPHLPSETQMYVPKVMATIELREGRPFRPSA